LRARSRTPCCACSAVKSVPYLKSGGKMIRKLAVLIAVAATTRANRVAGTTTCSARTKASRPRGPRC
jgi:hypothetical protein